MNNDDFLHNLINALNADLPVDQNSLASTNHENEPSLNPHHQFDPHHPHGIVIGNPTELTNNWNQQISPDDCGIAAQQNAIEYITNQSFSQEKLINYAQENNLYNPQSGITTEDFGKLITEITGIPVEHHHGATIDEISHKLIQGEQVFVGVNSTIEWLPDNNSILGQIAPDLFDPSHYQGAAANHIVQVIGVEIDPLNADNSYVIVNDSLSPDGKAMEIPIHQFEAAMKASDGYIATTEIYDSSTNQDTEMRFRGCDSYGFDDDRKNFYVNGELRGHCEGRKIYTGHFYGTFNTYKGRLGTDMNIYDSYDVKVGYLDSCGNVHKNDGTMVLSGENHSGLANVSYYLLDLLG